MSANGALGAVAAGTAERKARVRRRVSAAGNERGGPARDCRTGRDERIRHSAGGGGRGVQVVLPIVRGEDFVHYSMLDDPDFKMPRQ